MVCSCAVLQPDLHEHVARRLTHPDVPDRRLDRQHVDPGRGAGARLVTILDVDHRHLALALVGADVGDGRTRTVHGRRCHSARDTSVLRAPSDRSCGVDGRYRGDLAVDPDRNVHRHQVPGPDPVHRRHAHPHAAVRGGIVGDAVRAVDGFAAGEVLRSVDLAEVTLPPSLRELAVDVVQSVARHRVADLALARRVLVGLVVRDLAAGRRVEDPLRVSVGDDEQQLLRLVDLDQRAGVGAGLRALGDARHHGRRLRTERAVGGEAVVLLERHHRLLRGEVIVAVGVLHPEAEFEQPPLGPLGRPAAATPDRLDRRVGDRHRRRDRRRGGGVDVVVVVVDVVVLVVVLVDVVVGGNVVVWWWLLDRGRHRRARHRSGRASGQSQHASREQEPHAFCLHDCRNATEAPPLNPVTSPTFPRRSVTVSITSVLRWAGTTCQYTDASPGSSHQIVSAYLTPLVRRVASCGWVTSDGQASSEPIG